MRGRLIPYCVHVKDARNHDFNRWKHCRHRKHSRKRCPSSEVVTALAAVEALSTILLSVVRASRAATAFSLCSSSFALILRAGYAPRRPTVQRSMKTGPFRSNSSALIRTSMCLYTPIYCTDMCAYVCIHIIYIYVYTQTQPHPCLYYCIVNRNSACRG